MLRPRHLLWLLACVCVCPITTAQVPTATGRTITMANTAWSMFIPSTYQPTGNQAALLVHFHGDPATFRNNAKYAGINAIILTVNYGGLSSAYQTPFASNTSLFATLLTDAQTRARAQPDISDSLTFDTLAVTSFSAGYAAIREILKQPTYYNQIDAIATLDSIHAGFVSYPNNKTLIASQMADWRRFAADAAAGNKTFILSHSQVDPVTYASTTLTANNLLTHIAAAATPNTYDGLGTLDIYRTASKGNFHLYGALGTDADSHLEHLRYSGEFLKQLPLTSIPEPAACLAIVSCILLIRPPLTKNNR